MNITKKALYTGTKLLLFAVAAALAFSATPAFAGPTLTPCPIMTGGNAGGGGGVSGTYSGNTSGGTTNGCNVVITFNSNGSITSSVQNGASSYDNGGDDNLIGIVNNSSNTLFSITLTSGTNPIFGFDGDGACDPTWTFAGGNPCGSATSGYAPSGVSFSPTNNFSGTVSFAGGIASGQTAWFSLEGPASLNLQVNTTPEPESLLLLGTGLLAVGFALYRRNA